MTNQLTTLLLNWFANPYHAPIFIARDAGYYREAGLDLAIIQPDDPSDVTRIVASGLVDIGLKAMIHTVAGRARGYNITSIATLLDEPVTGLISLKKSPVEHFSAIKGKRLGYIGEFGKQIIDNLAAHAGIAPDEYQTVRVGMHMVSAIQHGIIDAGIGFSNFHQIELQASVGPTVMLRIDELAGLGCCCFCSIQIITHGQFLADKPEILSAFLSATERGAAYVTQYPEQAWEMLTQSRPQWRSETWRSIFIHTLPLFSRNLLNIERDWQKVYQYTRHLGLHAGDLPLAECYTNKFIGIRPHTTTAAVAHCI